MIRFLIDEDVNQRALRTIPMAEKGFDVLYPEVGGYKGAYDQSVRKLATAERRVLVTCDKDFSRFNARPEQFPYGVLLFRQSPRISQRSLGEILVRFCSFALTTFPNDPYNFNGKILEIYDERVEIQSSEGLKVYNFP